MQEMEVFSTNDTRVIGYPYEKVSLNPYLTLYIEDIVKKIRQTVEQEKILQKTHLTKDWYPGYINNLYNSIIKKWTGQFKNEQNI